MCCKIYSASSSWQCKILSNFKLLAELSLAIRDVEKSDRVITILKFWSLCSSTAVFVGNRSKRAYFKLFVTRQPHC